MLRATFAGFSVARGAMSASQKALDVTGQNISNVYTEGYTRQRLDQVSFASGYGNYASTNYVTQIGNGVLVTGVSQLRDPYLDIQYRNQIANVGMADSKASALGELADVFDETMKSAIKDAFSDLESKLLDLANSTGAELDDSIVRSSIQSLVSLFHFNATSLASKREEVTSDFETGSIRKINALMKEIAELNKTIKSSHTLGYPALELQDKRNQRLDELASYVPIEVIYKDDWLSKTEKVDSLEVNMILSDGTKVNLIDHNKYGEFSSETYAASKFTHVTFKDANNNVTNITNATPSTGKVNDLMDEIANLNGQIAANPTDSALTERRTQLLNTLKSYVPGISIGNNSDTVELQTDTGTISLINGGSVDNKFTFNQANNTVSVGNQELAANTLNVVENDRSISINSGTFNGTLNMLNSSGVFDGDATTVKGFGYYEHAFDLLVNEFASVFNGLNQPTLDANGNPALDANGNPGAGGNLFVTSDGSSSFTAANIKVNDEWIKGNIQLKTKLDTMSGTTQNDNINKFIASLNDKRDFKNNNDTLYNGNFYNYYVDIESTLGIDQQATDGLLKNHITVVNTIAQSKDQVSGVSLDEEGITLMQYQQSYTAAARLMTTLDDTLQTLLNTVGS